MTREETREWLKSELPKLLKEDSELRAIVVEALGEEFVRRDEWQKVEQALQRLADETAELVRIAHNHDRAIQNLNEQMAELIRIVRDHDQTLVEHSRIIKEHSRIIKEHSRVIEEHSAAIAQNTAATREMVMQLREHGEEITLLRQSADKLERRIGALGARWGLESEKAFRNGLLGILEGMGYQVERIELKDEEGFVFHGRPAQVELDLLVHDDKPIAVELASSVSINDVAAFLRKVEFLERLRGIQIRRRIVITPFIKDEDKARAEWWGVEVYSDPTELPPL